MKSYKIFLRLEVIETLQSIRPAARLPVARFIEALANNPNQVGDFTEKDESGRQIEIKVIGQYAITYWTDHPVSEVKVTDIRLADSA